MTWMKMNEEAALLRAYRETDYVVFAEPPFTLRVDEANPALLDLQETRGVRVSVYLTACNPGSQLLPEAENADRQARLRSTLVARAHPLYEGIGRHPGGGWPGEPSFLILGLELAEAVALGREWGQRAILSAGADAIPRLVFLD